jgi:hypothetical protein
MVHQSGGLQCERERRRGRSEARREKKKEGKDKDEMKIAPNSQFI